MFPKRIFLRHCCLRISRSQSHSTTVKTYRENISFDYSYRSSVAFLLFLFFLSACTAQSTHHFSLSLSLSFSVHLCAHVLVHAHARSRIPAYFSANIVLFFSVAFHISSLPARNYVSYCNEYYIKWERGQMQEIKSKRNACFFCRKLAYKRKLEKWRCFLRKGPRKEHR